MNTPATSFILRSLLERPPSNQTTATLHDEVSELIERQIQQKDDMFDNDDWLTDFQLPESVSPTQISNFTPLEPVSIPVSIPLSSLPTPLEFSQTSLVSPLPLPQQKLKWTYLPKNTPLEIVKLQKPIIHLYNVQKTKIYIITIPKKITVLPSSKFLTIIKKTQEDKVKLEIKFD